MNLGEAGGWAGGEAELFDNGGVAESEQVESVVCLERDGGPGGNNEEIASFDVPATSAHIDAATAVKDLANFHTAFHRLCRCIRICLLCNRGKDAALVTLPQFITLMGILHVSFARARPVDRINNP